MTSEIRTNTLKNRVGLGTISFTNTGAIVSGIVTANSFSGPISGTTGTFSGNVFLGDDDNLYLGASNDLRIYHAAGAASHINAVGLVNIDGTTGVRLEYNNANRVHCTSTGVTIGGDLDVDAHTNLDNVSIAGVTTISSNLHVSGTTNLSAELRANANIRMTNAGPKITFVDSNHDPDYEIGNYDGVFRIRDNTNSVDRIVVNTGDVILSNSNHVTQVLKAGGSTSDLAIDFKDSSNNLEARIFCASDQGDLRFYTGGANERLRIRSDGDTELRNIVAGINDSYSQYLKFRTTQSNGQSAITGAIRAQGKSNWGGELVFYSKPANGTPNDSVSEAFRINTDGDLKVGTTGNSGAKIQIGNHTFAGTNFAYNNDRVGFQNNGSLTCISNCSTYNDVVHPGYGVVLVQGANTSSYNVWGICPDGPAKGNSLNLHYGAQATNIHAPSLRKFQFTGEGYLLKPNHPTFYIRRSIGGNGRSAATPITEWSSTYNNGAHNNGGHFNTSTGLFTAPVSGHYHFSACGGYKQTGISFNQKFRLNNTPITEGTRLVSGLTDHSTATISATIYMTAGQTLGLMIEFEHHVNTTYNFFSGHLVG